MKVIPVIKYADGESQNDSTFIFEKIDKLFTSRPIIPQDPLLGFLALLLEDMFDEWGTKVMFGMRWLREVDQVWSARYLLYDSQLGQGNHLEEVREQLPNVLMKINVYSLPSWPPWVTCLGLVKWRE